MKPVQAPFFDLNETPLDGSGHQEAILRTRSTIAAGAAPDRTLTGYTRRMARSARAAAAPARLREFDGLAPCGNRCGKAKGADLRLEGRLRGGVAVHDVGGARPRGKLAQPG